MSFLTLGLLFAGQLTGLSPEDTEVEKRRVDEPTTKELGQLVSADVIVYGGTSAGIAAAVTVARIGHSVIVVSPDVHLGGLSSSGLGWTDSGNKVVIGGMAREFYGRIFEHYEEDDAWTWQAREDYGNRGQGTPAIDGAARTMWIFEPHAAEETFEAWVHEHSLRVDRNAWLDRSEGGVTFEGHNITSFRTLGGTTYRGSIFIDATYEGDLMAAAGVSYHVGREANSTYGETYNGVQSRLRHGHHFDEVDEPVDPYAVPGDPSSGLIAKISAEPPGEAGSADHRIQAYCFRLCLTDHPKNRVPFARPAGYDPQDYELMARVFEGGWRRTIPPSSPVPNRKTDTNNKGPMSTDNIGANYGYPEGSYEERRAIVAEHERYQKGWLYFLKTSPRVPEETRAQMTTWGLAGDEFVDNENWPYHIYVREARRMVSDFVLTEKHVMGREPTPSSVGMGSYTMDSHNTQRYVTEAGTVANEGDVEVPTPGPYAIPYGALVPKRDECQNLLVPVCISSSHIAFGSARMEPVFMILGESAAVAACLAMEGDSAVQDVDYGALSKALVQRGQILEIPPRVQDDLDARRNAERERSVSLEQLGGQVIDDLDADLSGPWQLSTSSARFVGPGYHHDGDRRDGLLTATYQATVQTAGKYEVRLAFPYASNRATNARVTIARDGLDDLILRVNQREVPAIDSLCVSLGTFALGAGGTLTVTLSNEGADGYVVADALHIVRAAD